jgi:regulator of sigma E protease
MAGLRAEDTVVKAKLIPPESEVLRSLEVEQSQVSLPFSDKDRNWPALINALQNTLPGTTVELTIFRHRSEQTVKLEPVEAPDWFNPDRGLQFEPTTFLAKPESIGEACAMGGQETLDSLTIVFRSLKKISTNQVSPRKMMGPVGIIKITLQAADQGPAMLLLFLTLLSVNLALVNFLPIPVLDGGHMMFLIYEGIRGKPADERVQVVLTYIGLGLILALMIWALGLDFGLISRW